MSQPKLRIGIVGAGKMGRLHSARLAERTDATLSGIFDLNFPFATALAAEVGTEAFADLDALLFESDAVVVATSTASHFPVGSKVLSAGVHLLLEKPATGFVDTAMRLFKLADEKGLVVKIGFLERARLLSVPRELMASSALRSAVRPSSSKS